MSRCLVLFVESSILDKQSADTYAFARGGSDKYRHHACCTLAYTSQALVNQALMKRQGLWHHHPSSLGFMTSLHNAEVACPCVYSLFSNVFYLSFNGSILSLSLRIRLTCIPFFFFFLGSFAIGRGEGEKGR